MLRYFVFHKNTVEKAQFTFLCNSYSSSTNNNYSIQRLSFVQTRIVSSFAYRSLFIGLACRMQLTLIDC